MSPMPTRPFRPAHQDVFDIVLGEHMQFLVGDRIKRQVLMRVLAEVGLFDMRACFNGDLAWSVGLEVAPEHGDVA